MECGEGLLTAFGLGFTPHIQGQAGTDLHLCPHPIDTLLHLAIASVARSTAFEVAGSSLSSRNVRAFSKVGEKSFLRVLPTWGNRRSRRRRVASLSRAVWVRQRRSNNAYTWSMTARSPRNWGNPRLTRHRVLRSVLFRWRWTNRYRWVNNAAPCAASRFLVRAAAFAAGV